MTSITDAKQALNKLSNDDLVALTMFLIIEPNAFTKELADRQTMSELGVTDLILDIENNSFESINFNKSRGAKNWIAKINIIKKYLNRDFLDRSDFNKFSAESIQKDDILEFASNYLEDGEKKESRVYYKVMGKTMNKLFLKQADLFA